MTRERLRFVALASGGVALLWLVREGSLHWQILRFTVVAALTVAAIRAVDRTRRRTPGLVEFCAAIVALVAGFGIAPAWLTKAPLTVTAVAGLVLVVAGLALLTIGTRDLLPRTSRGLKILAGVPLVLTAVLIVFSASIGVAATNIPPTSVGATPADRGITYGDVGLVTEDGVDLAAWYVPSQNGAAVVLLHGAGSTRSAVLDELEMLVAHGYGVLAYDARGHGDSGGRAMDFGWWGQWDTFAAIDWLRESPDVEDGRIGLVGLSMGGEVAIGTAAFHGKVAAVVAEGATNRVAADKDWMPTVFGWRGNVQQALDAITYGTADLLTDTSPPITLRDAVVATAPRPVLLLTAADVEDEGHAAGWIASGSPDTVTVVEMPGGHVGGLETDSVLWQQTVIGFLDEALR